MSLKDEIRALAADKRVELERADKQQSDALAESQAKFQEIQPFLEEIQAAGGQIEFNEGVAEAVIWVGDFDYRPYAWSICPPEGVSLDPGQKGLMWQVGEKMTGKPHNYYYFVSVSAMFEHIVPRLAEAIAVYEHGQSNI